MENRCQTKGMFEQDTRKPGLTFQLYASDGIIVGSDEGIQARGDKWVKKYFSESKKNNNL